MTTKCREFKVGDKVERLTPNLDLEVGGVYEVKSVDYGWIGLFGEGHTNYDASYFKLVADERQALSDAIDLCVKHDVHIGSYDGCADEFYWHSSQRARGKFSKVTVLDLVFPPTETKEQVKLKELEEKQLLIADEMKKLRESMV